MTRPEGAPRRPVSRVKKKDKYVAGAEEGRGEQRNGGENHLEHHTVASLRRWRDAGEEVKNHNVSHVDVGNFIKLRSSGV